MATSSAAGEPFESQVREVFSRIAGDLCMLIDQHVRIESTGAERWSAKPVGAAQVHIAFKLSFELRGELRHGALLVPLPEAISLAGFLLLGSADEVKLKRAEPGLDQATKDAMLEIGSFIGGAADGALRPRFPRGLSVRSGGCQGLRADQPPGFPHPAGQDLIVGRAQACIAEFPSFELLLLMPLLAAETAPAS